jgi:hypothetical protein
VADTGWGPAAFFLGGIVRSCHVKLIAGLFRDMESFFLDVCPFPSKFVLAPSPPADSMTDPNILALNASNPLLRPASLGLSVSLLLLSHRSFSTLA